jgi:hypothetical protein
MAMFICSGVSKLCKLRLLGRRRELKSFVKGRRSMFASRPRCIVAGAGHRLNKQALPRQPPGKQRGVLPFFPLTESMASPEHLGPALPKFARRFSVICDGRAGYSSNAIQ